LSKKKKKKSDKGKFKKTWGYVWPFFAQYRKRVFLVLVLTIFASIADPGLAFMVKPVINGIIEDPERAKGLLWIPAIGIIALFMYRATFQFLSKYLLERLYIRVIKDIRVALYRHFMFLSLDHYNRTNTGEMMSRTVNDVGQMQKVVPLTIDTLHNVFTLMGLVGVCFYMQPYLSILAFVAIPLTVYPTERIGRAMKRYTKKGLKQVAGIHSIMQETYSGNKVVKAFAMEQEEVNRYESENERLIKIQFKYSAVKHLISPMIGVITSFGTAVVFYIGMSKLIDEARANPEVVGEFASYIVALGLMYNPVRKLGSIFGSYSTAYAAAERIQETFEKQSTVTEDPDAIELPPIEKEIRYENVSFKYEDKMVLKDFDLVANKGELVALVGVSGTGKSTIVNMLPRFYDVTEGRITIDGVDIRKATLRGLRLQIGVVTQETFLFNDTVSNNIMYGSEGKSPDDVVRAARAANAHDFISKLPNGYDTIIGERGVRLSGGEKQRIAIARALLKDPPILILDEATSALDTCAEREVQVALEELMKNRTTVAIAHRLSTIRHADKIVVISDGRVAEEGTHNQLMSRDGEYKRLYEMQFFLGEYATDHYGPEEECEADTVKG